MDDIFRKKHCAPNSKIFTLRRNTWKIVILGKSDIPDQAIMHYAVSQSQELLASSAIDVASPRFHDVRDGGHKQHITACFETAAPAAGCKVQITATATLNEITGYSDLVLNTMPGDELADVVLKRYDTNRV
ncbi:hypothetical protein BDR07DRAFT_1444841 [Suillus spraguei]|nr:hypothetical protein BDR07DRAFT_1444841 [Suillus spraguei]